MRRRSPSGRLRALILAAGTLLAGLACAGTDGVVISQVYGGNGNVYARDYVELFNAGSSTVAIDGWSVQYASASGTGQFAANGVAVLSGSLAPGQFYLVALASGGAGAALPAADASGSTNLSSSSGKVALVRSSTGLACNGGSTACSAAQLALIADLVGYGSANFFEGSAAAPGLGSSTALFRAAGGCTDSGVNGTDFSSGTPAPRNTASPLSPCGGSGVGAAIIPVCPVSPGIATGAAVFLPLRASDADSIVNSATLTGAVPQGVSLGPLTAAVGDGGTAAVQVLLDGSTPSGSYTVNVQFGNNAAQTASCSIALQIQAVGSAYTPIFTLQGAGSATPLPGVRTTRGVVTKVNSDGYFLQDPAGDGDPLTSDAIFVYTATAPPVSAGHRVQVTGTVLEFNTGSASNAITLANPLTEISNVTSTVLTGTGAVSPVSVALPVAASGDMERYEGMLVTIVTPLTVGQNYFLGRYGQLTVAAGGRPIKPTNLYRPGTAAAIALADLNARSLILLDDGSSGQNPNPIPYIGTDDTVRAGDSIAAGTTGVIDYGLATSDSNGAGLYRLHPTVAPVISRSNPRPSQPPTVGGSHRVASFNVLNYFTTFGNGQTAGGASGQGCLPSGTTADCRGASNASEFARQRDKIVRAIAAIDADVVGLMEIQRNGSTAAQNLVDGLNAYLGASAYAVVPEPSSGVGTDAIKVAMIYKPARLALAGGGLSDGSAVHNRPPVAQTFQSGAGARFSVIVNHFKSKGCDGASGGDADQKDLQGCYNARRVQQAQALLAFIDTVKAAAGDGDVLVIGDLNAYAQEDPVDTLRAGGLVDQVLRYNGGGNYSYVFDGEAGSLDYGLATPSLSAQVVGAAHWRVNADEPSVIDYNTEFKTQDLYAVSPYRSSDHDPVVIGLQLAVNPVAQTISLGPLVARRVDQSPVTVTASASSGLPVTLSSLTPSVCTVAGSRVDLLVAGVCTLAADQGGDPFWAPANRVVQSFPVNAGQAQTISFVQPAARSLGSPPFLLTATASSGLPVGATSLTPAVCAVSESMVTVLAPGTCRIEATQSGDAQWLPASSVERAFAVTGGTPAADREAEVPLPAWVLWLLGAGLARRLSRSRCSPV
ncbi:MAG: ExeM/NucH family extracellular endonuclease [Betaproteobacteria bacterium]